VSATNRGAKRNENDFYATPEWCVDLISDEIDWKDIFRFYEPCKGDGAIYNKINMPEDKKHFDEISEGKDYLVGEKRRVDLIVTNPPFSLALEFLEKSMGHSVNIAFLLRLNFLGSQRRKPFWEKYGTPSRLFVLSKRPSFAGRGTDATEYAWFCWGDSFKRNPGIYIL
jgi:hypothetical protein